MAKASNLNWPRRCALFLSPASDDLDLLTNLVKKQRGRLDLPAFEPHVTLYTGTFAELATLERALAMAIEGVMPITLTVRGIVCTEEYFKTLFLDFGEDASLRSIHERFRDNCGVSSGYELHPHLSLVYADIPLAEKEILAKEVALPRREFSFDRVKLVTPGNSIEGWRDTISWETLLELELTGSAQAILSGQNI
jgi:putative hydrolase of the HAD superfamily